MNGTRKVSKRRVIGNGRPLVVIDRSRVTELLKDPERAMENARRAHEFCLLQDKENKTNDSQ